MTADYIILFKQPDHSSGIALQPARDKAEAERLWNARNELLEIERPATQIITPAAHRHLQPLETVR